MAKRRVTDPDDILLSDELRARVVAGYPRQCVARRHMTPSEYMTYNAMFACATPGRAQNGGKLIFKAGDFWLANANVRSVNTERDNLTSLEESGWIVLTKKKVGGTDWYEVIEHEAYEQKYPEKCPKNKYVDDLMADLTGLKKNSLIAVDTEGKPQVQSNLARANQLKQAARPMAKALKSLSDDDREKIVKHLKARNRKG